MSPPPPAEAAAGPVVPRPRRPNVAALLLAVAVVNTAAVNLALLATGTRFHETTLHPIWWFFTGRQGSDSWRPMRRALHFATTPEGRGAGLYEKLFFSPAVRHKGFQYPPTSLVPLWLVEGRGREGVAEVLAWCAVPLAAFFVFRLLQQGQARLGEGSPPLLLLAAAFALTVSFYPFIRAYRNGQAQAWINALTVVAVYAGSRGRWGAAGALAAVCAALKPQYGLVFLWAIVRRRWGLLGGGAAVLVPLLAASVALFGLQPHLDYVRVAQYVSERGEAFYPNQSVNGLLHRLLGTWESVVWVERFPRYVPLVHAGTLVSSALLVGLALWPPRARAARGGLLDFCLAVLVSTMASPIAWEHHYGVLLPIFAVLLPVSLARGRRTLAWLGLAYFLSASSFMWTNRFAGTALSVLQSYLFAAALVVLVLLVRSREEDGPDGNESVRSSPPSPAPAR